MGATNPVDALTVVLRKLNVAGHPYMLTGSVAALFYGRDRTTVDVDVVLDCTNIDVLAFVAALAPEYFLDDEMLRASMDTKQMFNAIPLLGGPKIDFIPLTTDALDQVAFGRRVQRDWFGTQAFAITAMDLVINKLRRAKDSMSERQLGDVRAILANNVIDDPTEFERWVRRLGLQPGLDASRTTRYEA